MGASGAAPPNLLITLAITGANAHQLQATTDSTGLASFTYLGVNAGTDQVQAFAQITGLPEVSNVPPLTWNPPPPPPPISPPTPSVRPMVTKPVAINPALPPPSGPPSPSSR